jgi:hypothetical protein
VPKNGEMPDRIRLLEEPSHLVELEPGPQPLLFIGGSMDERFDFGKFRAALAPHLVAKNDLRIDLSAVVRINSQGLLGWHQFIDSAEKTMRVRFVAVSEAVTEQAAILPSVFGKAGTPIDTFETPYLCVPCNKRHTKFLKKSELVRAGDDFKAPPLNCPDCSTEMEFDALEPDYFDFLKRH